MSVILIAAMVLGISASVLLIVIIAKSIAKPARALAAAASSIATGKTNVRLDIEERRDEIGALATTFTGIIDLFKQQAECLDSISDGDFTVSITPLFAARHRGRSDSQHSG